MAMTSLRLDKAAFFGYVGYEPHAGQLEVHMSTASRRIVASGVRWGKTLCAAMEGVAAALEPKERSYGWVCAATYDLADKVFRELVILTAEHLRHRIVTLKESERKLVLRNLGDGRHTFVSDGFFKSIAVRQLGSSDGVVSNPVLKAVEVPPKAQKTLEFVPVTPGAYHLECSVFLHETFGMAGQIAIR